MNTLNRYLDEIEKVLAKVRGTQLPKMEEAARMLCDATINGHNLFAFGCNHAGLLALELYYRTGGMVNINPVRGPGLNLDINPPTATSRMERIRDYGRVLIDSTPIGRDDVIIIHSVSGRNTVTVDAAVRAREKGAKVIALTNMQTSAAVASRHESGLNLYQAADLVIDNCGCLGDAALDIDRVPTRVGASSTVIGAAILNAVIAETIALITASGHDAPVFISANLDGGDELNDATLKAYKDHIFYM